MAPIRVSRSGLTECPSCHAHMEVSAEVRGSVCPFCGAALHGGPDAADRGLRRLSGLGGRSGLLAATLLGALAVTACEDNGDGSNATADSGSPDGGSIADSADTGTSDTTPADAAGTDSDVLVGSDTTPDPDTPVAMYGLPPEDVTTGDTAHEDDIAIMPMYGMPADIEQQDPDAKAEEDIAVFPVYGLPADIIEEAPDAVSQPKYGGPPLDAQ